MHPPKGDRVSIRRIVSQPIILVASDKPNEQILKRLIYAPRLGWPNFSNELGLSAPAPSPLPHRLSRGYLGLVLWGPARLYGHFALLHLKLCGPEVALQELCSVLWFSPTPPTL